MNGAIIEEIIRVLTVAHEPLETKEIQTRISEKAVRESVTRTKIFYRLNLLRGDGKIKGKFVGSGKGVWIWWIDSFERREDFSRENNFAR